VKEESVKDGERNLPGHDTPSTETVLLAVLDILGFSNMVRDMPLGAVRNKLETLRRRIVEAQVVSNLVSCCQESGTRLNVKRQDLTPVY